MRSLSDYIADTRRITRITSTTPFNDAVFTRFINEAKDYVSSLVPFALVHSFYSSHIGKAAYHLPRDILVVLTCRIYPYAGSYLIQTIGEYDDFVPVYNPTVFPETGYVRIGDPPTTEIISYSGRQIGLSRLTGCGRGLFGTRRRQWVYNPTTFVPVRVWQSGAQWSVPSPVTDISVFLDAEWEYTPEELQRSGVVPSQFGVRGSSLFFDKPFAVDGFANIQLHTLIVPPDMVESTDTVYGLPDAFERIIPVCAAMFVLKALGGEDALIRMQTLQEEFTALLHRLQAHQENLRGQFGGIAIETYRPSSPTSGGVKRHG